MLYSVLIIGALFTTMPFLWLLRSSVMNMREIFTMPPVWLPEKPQWKNFADVFTMLPFGRFFLNSGIIVALNIIGALFSNTIMAYAFARIDFRGRNIMYALCLSTLMLPQVVTLVPLVVIWKYLGGLNTFAPLTVPAFFGNAFYIFMLHQFFKTIPLEYDEAAFVDGANYLQIILNVIMPISKPALAVVAIFSFMYTWNDFFGPLLFLNEEKMYTVALGLKMLTGMYSTQWHILMAAATFVVLPLIVLFFFAQKYFIEGLTLGGLKG